MTPELEQLKSAIAKHMEAWAGEFIHDRIAFLKKRKVESTGELIDSMAAEMNRQARREAVELLLAFEEHGRYIDMKRLHPAKGGNAVVSVEDWMKRKGFVDAFTKRYVKKYNMKKTPSNVLNKIAWGIVIARSGGKVKRRPWYNKPRTAAVADLYNEVAAMIPDVVADQLKSNFSKTK